LAVFAYLFRLFAAFLIKAKATGWKLVLINGLLVNAKLKIKITEIHSFSWAWEWEIWKATAEHAKVKDVQASAKRENEKPWNLNW